MTSLSFTTPMTNPYSQKAPSVENLLKNLTRTRGAPTLAMVQSVQEQMMQTQIEWTLEMARDLCSLTMRILNLPDSQNTSISEGCVATLRLLINTMEQWQDNVVYAVLVQDSNSQGDSKHLLDLLIKLSKRDHQLHFTALVGLATASRALDRLQQLTSLDSNVPDSAWWFIEEDSEHLAKLSFQILSSGLDDDGFHAGSSDMSIPTPEQIKLGANSILCHILKRERGSFREYFDDEELRMLCSKLLMEVQCLINPELSRTATSETLSIAILSTTLLALIQWKIGLDLSDLDRMIQTTALVGNIVHFVFPATQRESFSNGPRWTWDGQFDQSQKHALDLIHCWSICSDDAWSIFKKHESHWRPFIESSWTYILLDQQADLATILPKLFLLHTSCRLAARNILAMTIQKIQRENDTESNLYRSLLSRLSTKSSNPSHVVRTVSARLLWIVLSDRKSISTHDDMSRALWAAVDNDLLERCLTATIGIASTDDIQQPYLLVLLDLLNVFFEVVENCNYALSRLGAQSVEKLVYLVKPKEVKFDFMNMLDDDNDESGDESTPPANNLSRLDETSICVEHEEEKEPRGFDHTIRLAAASVLSRLGYHSSLPANESIGLLVSRICTAVNDFLASLHEAANNSEHDPMSIDLYKRSFRLQVTVATQENEDFVATLLFTKQVHRDQRLRQLRQENKAKQQQLHEVSRREERLQAEKQKYLQQSRSQSIVLKRELTKMKKSAVQDARQLVAMHVSERSNAESRATEFKKQSEQSESQLQEAKRQVEESKLLEGRIEEELHMTNSRVKELGSKNEDLACLMREETTKSNELEERLSATSEEIDSLRGRKSELEGEVDYFKDDNKHLLNNLEDLFADMVSMAQIHKFEKKEHNSSSEKRKGEVEELSGKLRSERTRNKEITESLKSLRAENEKLFRKVAKYKETLEQERSQRHDEKQRRKQSGPVSYINQLHDSQRSSRNESTYDKSSKSSRSRLGKENSYYASSSSQRRKNYKEATNS